MEIRLSPETEQWLKAQVAQGRFGSIDEAVEALVREEQAVQSEIDQADLSWARPYVERGLSDIEEGRTVAADDVHAEMRQRFTRQS